MLSTPKIEVTSVVPELWVFGVETLVGAPCLHTETPFNLSTLFSQSISIGRLPHAQVLFSVLEVQRQHYKVPALMERPF